MRNIFIAVVMMLFALAGNPVHGEQPVVYRAVANDGVQRVEMAGGGYFFVPAHVVVKKGIPVELVVRKEPGMVPHNIVMSSPDAGMVFDESLEEKPKTITFTPTKTGTFPFYCSKKLLFFASHREKGMEGALEVTE